MINYDEVAAMIARARPQPMAPGHVQVAPASGTNVAVGVDLEGLYKLSKDIFDLDDTKADALIDQMAQKYTERLYLGEAESAVNQEFDVPVFQDKLREAYERGNTNVRVFEIPATTKDKEFGEQTPTGPNAPSRLTDVYGPRPSTAAPPDYQTYEGQPTQRVVGQTAQFRPEVDTGRAMRKFYVPTKQAYGKQAPHATQPQIEAGMYGDRFLQYKPGPGAGAGTGEGAKLSPDLQRAWDSWFDFTKQQAAPIDPVQKDAPVKVANTSARTSEMVTLMVNGGRPDKIAPILDYYYQVTNPLYEDYVRSGDESKKQISKNIVASYTAMQKRAMQSGTSDRTSLTRLFDMVYMVAQGDPRGGQFDREARKKNTEKYMANNFAPTFLTITDNLPEKEVKKRQEANEQIAARWLDGLDIIWSGSKSSYYDREQSAQETAQAEFLAGEQLRKEGVRKEVTKGRVAPGTVRFGPPEPEESPWLRRIFGIRPKPKSGQ